MAPIAAPTFLPMADVLAEKVTLEAGARGLRGLFSSKPSDKDVQRVKRNWLLAARALRAVFAADGPWTPRSVATSRLSSAPSRLPNADSARSTARCRWPLRSWTCTAISSLRWRGRCSGARGSRQPGTPSTRGRRDRAHGGAEDLHPAARGRSAARRSGGARRCASGCGPGGSGSGALRAHRSRARPWACSQQRCSPAAAAAVPRRGAGPRRALDQGAALQAAGQLPGEQRCWCWPSGGCAACTKTTVGLRALRARHDRFAADLGEDGAKVRAAIDQWVSDVLAPAAYPMTADPK